METSQKLNSSLTGSYTVQWARKTQEFQNVMFLLKPYCYHIQINRNKENYTIV